MASEQPELLFFDTFSHETSEELNLDLVQFTKTVCVTEVRVIPLGARVQADFPGGVRLGATNPSQFKIEFFVNDLSKPGASAFESVGGMEYNQNGNIHVECEQRIPTDGLVLRGWYTTITLAVYGYLTKAIVHETPPPVPGGPPVDTGPVTPSGWQPTGQVGELPQDGYVVEPSRDPYMTGPYPEESYPPPHPDYPSHPHPHPHPYQEEWPQPAEGYEGAKEPMYEGEWDQRTPEDKSGWERDMRHRGEREFRDHNSPEFDRARGPRGDFHYPRGPPHHRGWTGRPRSPPPHRAGARTPPPPPTAEPTPATSPQEKRADTTSPQAPFDSLSPGDVESISEGEIPEAEGEVEGVEGAVVRQATPSTPSPPPPPAPEEPTMDVEPFEPILSDEEMPDDTDAQFQDMADYDFPDYAEDAMKTFNPYNFELQPFVHLSDPAKTSLEWQRSHHPSPPSAAKVGELLASVAKERSTAAQREEWVHAAEQLITLLPAALPHVDKFDEVIDTVISWVDIGLDFEDALSQPQPGYKLRHIKAGIRLVEALCQCGEEVTERLMAKVNVHKKLIELFHQDYMALSIKLMILRSLDASLRYKKAVEHFLEGKDWNGYKKLLEMVRAKQLARVQYAITSILQKLHLYEALDKLNKSVAELVVEEGKENESETAELDLESIANSIEQIINVYKNAPTMVSHPKRFLSVSAQFEINSGSNPDPYPALFTYFRTHRLLESFLILLTHPGTSCYSSIVIPIQEMITILQESQDGLRFLYAVSETINPLIRVLLGGPSSGEENEDTQESSSSQLGLHLIYRLQAMSHIDHLMDLYARGKTDAEDSEVIEHLQSLYCLTFSAIGKMAVVHVLSKGDNAAVLLKYFKGKTVEKDSKVKKFPGKSYIGDLISMTIKYSDYVPFLQKYVKELLDKVVNDSSQEYNELSSWLKPVENPSAFAYDDISGLVELIKKNIEQATSLPGELITAVRVLKYLGIPPNDSERSINVPDSFGFSELKYKCVIIQLFSLEGISHLSAVIQKLCENYEQPALHSAKLVGRQGLALTSFLHPAMKLIRKVLTHVIKCRNTEFKDLTMIPVLLQTYSLMQAIPVTAHAHLEAQKVSRDVVETLLAYTQPVAADPSSETEALNKSLWTLMVTEVLKFTVATPHNFLPGLSLLSELLPLPLQVQTRSPLPDEEIKRVVNCRKLWSAHLHCLGSLIHETITTMCCSSYSPLLQLLRSVCSQLADLAAPTALTVTRAVLDSIVKAVTPPERPVTSHMMRLLTFLACMTTHASVKAALLNLIVRQPSSDKAHQRYPDLVVSLCHILRAPHDCPTHVQAQECIVSVVQSLCHCELTLVPPPGVVLVGATTPHPDTYLANTLPPRDLLGTLLLVMLEHVGDARNNLTTLQPSLRTFLMLTEHDYGFFHLKNCLEKKPEALMNLVAKIVSVWNTERTDCLSTLSTLLELLRGCITPDAPDEVLGLPARAITLSPPELANILGWEKNSEEKKHPLYTVDTLLQESRSEDETLESLCENVTELIRLLEEEGSKPLETKEVPEPMLPSPDTLLAQFSARPVFVVGEVEDDRLAAGYWLSVPPPDDQDSEMQQVAADLLEVVAKDVPDFPLAEKVATLCRHKAVGDLDTSTSPNTHTNTTADNSSRRPFVAPMRGRGFRGSVQRGDMFRSRPPNTSRPPSLHVDDFVALETCGAQPTGPTGYNKISMRAAQDIIASRVRGRPRPFGVDRGGRFFPTPYPGRRESDGRESLSPHWHAEAAGSSGPSGGSFRALPPDMRSGHFSNGRAPLRAPPPPSHSWPTKDSRERFSSPNMRAGPPHRSEQNRHMGRFFSR
ncbi:protein virilizer-like isoform X1 [Macrosteles quadrilineatus]|uniref:protein virilizer-like isoform X1 n=1 Tax=Macrosteles quadrilineatus TaxID=74068 RepID=UPI0023E2DB02|nr:protein virilizer-like isoform X1 [Macrosteles quadrilineatus]